MKRVRVIIRIRRMVTDRSLVHSYLLCSVLNIPLMAIDLPKSRSQHRI